MAVAWEEAAVVVEGEETATRLPCVYNCMILLQAEAGVAEGSEEAAVGADLEEAGVVEGDETMTRAPETGAALSSEYLQFTSLHSICFIQRDESLEGLYKFLASLDKYWRSLRCSPSVGCWSSRQNL